jgi:hypothetical protein
MFKIMVLQALYTLSDDAEALIPNGATAWRHNSPPAMAARTRDLRPSQTKANAARSRMRSAVDTVFAAQNTGGCRQPSALHALP